MALVAFLNVQKIVQTIMSIQSFVTRLPEETLIALVPTRPQNDCLII